MYKVIEVANSLGVSKVTIYNKINHLKQEIKPHVYKKKGITYVDDTGVELIRKALGVNQGVNHLEIEVNSKEVVSNENEDKSSVVKELTHKIDSLQDGYINSLTGQINHLKKELEIKNEQLNTKDELIRNFQILLKEDKDRILLLEEKLKDKESQDKEPTEEIIDRVMNQVKAENEKLMEYIIVTRQEEQKFKEQNKKNWLQRLLGK